MSDTVNFLDVSYRYIAYSYTFVVCVDVGYTQDSVYTMVDNI